MEPRVIGNKYIFSEEIRDITLVINISLKKSKKIKILEKAGGNLFINGISCSSKSYFYIVSLLTKIYLYTRFYLVTCIFQFLLN